MPAYQHADTPALLQLVKYSDVYGGADFSTLATERIDSLSKAWQSSKQACHDAWGMPGYIWYGPSTRDVRWIPYSDMDEFVTEDVSQYDPEEHYDAFRDRALPSQYSKGHESLSELFRTHASRQKHETQLEFMRNKHVVSLGSSLDRNGVIGFCRTHQGCEETFMGNHHAARYHFADLNFTISFWFHYGVHNFSSWHRGQDPVSAGLTVEQRMDKVFKPFMRRYGRPDMLLFSTAGLWDAYYYREMLKQHGHYASLDDVPYEDLTPHQIQYHRSRLFALTKMLQTEFPDIPLLYRTTTSPRPTPDDADNRPIAMFQINQSARALMKKMNIPLLNWADLIQGNKEFEDGVHYHLDSRPTWLWGEQMLWHLQYFHNGNKNTSCWNTR